MSCLAKRLFDIVFSLFVLIALSPLFLVISLLIAIQSPGPVFYRCKRLGQGGKPIECFKFRTMRLDADLCLSQIIASDPRLRAEWKTYQKLRHDPRVTALGKFLRATSLDELPQFLNVLMGDLSVVGPRPPALFGPPEQFLEELRQIYGDYTNIILSVKPGITGVWQVSGRSSIPLEERRKIEAHYAQNRTFWNDFILIIKTVPAIFFSKGAY